jgi:hypothetical protein
LGAPFFGGEAEFHKIKGRETLISSHRNLKITDDKVGMTEGFSLSTELSSRNLKILLLKFLLIIFFNHAWSKPHVLSL